MSQIIQRRSFLSLLGTSVAAWPLAARAQQAAVPVVGFLSSAFPDAIANLTAAFMKGLSEAGYVEGRNVRIEYRWANNEFDRLPQLAVELVRHPVDIIVTLGSMPSTLAAKAATATIPIVFMVGGDPVRRGLVASLNRPGGNATGFAELNQEAGSKRIGILHDLLPAAMRFAVLVAPNSIMTSADFADLQVAAAKIGLQLEMIYAEGALVGDFDSAFATLMQRRVDAFMADPSAPHYNFRAQLTALAARHALPGIYWDRAMVQAGGLMSYGSSVTDQCHQVGIYAGRILKGEKPSELPVQQPTKFEFIINLQTAKAMGLTIPPGVLALADEVIE